MIAFFVYNLGYYSGAAKQAFGLAAQLSRQVIVFNVGTPYLKQDSIAKNVNVINLPDNKLHQCIAILFWFLKCRVCLVHFHGFFFLPKVISLLSRRKTVLKTTLLGDDDFHSIAGMRFGWLRLYLAKKIDRNIVLSRRAFQINSDFIKSDKICLIPNAVDIPEQAIPLEKKKNVFCFVGMVCERKNTLASIEYFHENFRHLPGAELYIAGPIEGFGVNAEFDPAYVEQCYKLVDKLQLHSQVFFTGTLDKPQLVEIYKKSKALLFFSHKEGMPNVVLEAMAYNCVPIVSPMDGVGDEIIGQEAGYVMNSPVSVSVTMLESLISRGVIFSRVHSSYSFASVVNSIEQLYEDICA